MAGTSHIYFYYMAYILELISFVQIVEERRQLSDGLQLVNSVTRTPDTIIALFSSLLHNPCHTPLPLMKLPLIRQSLQTVCRNVHKLQRDVQEHDLDYGMTF